MAAGAGYIEFSTGDILTASAANSYLASQVVMVFANAAARTSAIASPQEGMISYLKDTNATEYYSGSAWAAVGGGGGGGGGLVYIDRQAFSGVSSVSLTSKFSSTYDNYKIMLRLDSLSSSTQVFSRLRSGSTDNTSSNYRSGRVFELGSGITGIGETTGTGTYFGAITDWESQSSGFSMDLYHPYLTAYTAYTAQASYYYSAYGQHNQVDAGQMSVNTSYDGITFFPASGTMTGEVYLYGYARS